MKIVITVGPVKDEGLRYEQGYAYDVSPNVGHRFIGFGWADNAPRDVELSEPLTLSGLSDEQADELREQDRETAAARRDAGAAEPELDVDNVITRAETT